MKEVVDVVDPHGNVIGQAERDEAHKKDLLIQLVHVMVFDPQGRLFMQQRQTDKDVYPGFWEGSLSGHVQSGEAPLSAAEREMHEELHIFTTRKHIMEVARFGVHTDEVRCLATLYIIRDYQGKIQIDEEEVKQGAFWTQEQLEEELKKQDKFFHPVFLQALEVMKEMKINPREFVPV